MHRTATGDTGGVHDAVEPPAAADDRGHGRTNGIGVEHVDRLVGEPVVGETVGCLGSEVDADHDRALVQQSLDRRLADARGRAGNQYALAAEPVHCLALRDL